MQSKRQSQTTGVNMDREKLYEEIKADEGEVLEVYLDHLGYPTIGIGHLVTAEDEEFGKPAGTAITAERSRELFARDIQSAIEDCERLYGQWHNWPEEVQLIMVNMCFNLGATRLAKFRNMHNSCYPSITGNRRQKKAETQNGTAKSQIVPKD